MNNEKAGPQMRGGAKKEGRQRRNIFCLVSFWQKICSIGSLTNGRVSMPRCLVFLKLQRRGRVHMFL